jgi:RNA polymerase sigma-70 factor (ECF subfamily)
MDAHHKRVSLMLSAARNGSAVAASALMPLVYNQLRGLAGQYLRKERSNHTLQPTALVHEAYLRLLGPDDLGYEDKAHFLALAAITMRRILVDHARKKQTEKRWGGHQQVELTEQIQFQPDRPEDFLALNDAIVKLAELDPRQSKIVELHFFGGMTLEEIAAVVKVTPRTVQRDWSVARAWLHRQLTVGL